MQFLYSYDFMPHAQTNQQYPDPQPTTHQISLLNPMPKLLGEEYLKFLPPFFLAAIQLLNCFSAATPAVLMYWYVTVQQAIEPGGPITRHGVGPGLSLLTWP